VVRKGKGIAARETPEDALARAVATPSHTVTSAATDPPVGTDGRAVASDRHRRPGVHGRSVRLAGRFRRGVAVSSTGEIYVGDVSTGMRVQKFRRARRHAALRH